MRMTKKKFFYLVSLISLSFSLFSTSCSKRPLAPKIGNKLSFPGKLTTLDSSHFLLLNTVANNAYQDGSLQLYSVNSAGAYSLMNALSIPTHGSDVAVSSDGKLVALSFDSTYSNTTVKFYDYSNMNAPVALNIQLDLPNAGGKQSVNRLGFFKRASDNNYYLYGSINSFPKEDGTKGNIPARTFLAQINQNFTAVNLLVVLSYGLNDPKSLAKNSDALLPNMASDIVQYTFGYSAPTYVGGTSDLFIAFPTGTSGGNNSGANTFPFLPDALNYFAGTSRTATCSGAPCQSNPDFRAVSLAVVNMAELLAGNGINNSTYFVPLGWNQNVMPYNSVSNSRTIKAPNDASVSDLNSFSFQTGFWSSYWANTVSNSSGTGCYSTSTATAQGNQFTILGDNTVFAVKSGSNGSNDLSADGGKGGYGNEVIGISGFDKLKTTIGTILLAKPSPIVSGESDFKNIATYQLIDAYNSASNYKASWINQQGSNLLNTGPLSPFLYSRTTNAQNAKGDGIFDATPSGIANIGMLNFGSNICLPYWARSTIMISTMGRETSWLTTNSFNFSSTNSRYNNTYPYVGIDPAKLSVYSFKPGSGSQYCTEVSPTINNPKVFCANFLTSDISKYSVNQSDPVFTSY